MNNNQITRSELDLQPRAKTYQCGAFLHYRGCDGVELWKIVSQETDTRFVIALLDACTCKETGERRTVALSSLEQYYQPVCQDMERIHSLALRLLEGEELEEGIIQESGEDGTELMYLGDKATLTALRTELSNIEAAAEAVRQHAKCVADEIHRQMTAKVEKMNAMAAAMRRQIGRLDYVLQTIETYAGIKEEIFVVRKGMPADGSFPVVIRQAVIYLDEEMALMDPEFDWRVLDSFNDWLVQDDHYKQILPEVKSIVAIKPRRRDKAYSSGCTAEDRYYNWVMNEPNHHTMFLIRNGENVYRLDSEHIILEDRMFPNAGEYEEILRKEAQEENRWGKGRDEDYSEGLQFRKRFTRVSFLLQGLFDRSEVFAPHNFTGSLIKMQGLENHIKMHYELDLSHQLSDGRMAFRDWFRTLNEGLAEGNRILLVRAGMNHHGYEYSRKDYVVYRYNEWNTPGFPEDGVYTLYGSQPDENSVQTKHYFDSHPFLVKFRSAEPAYSWTGCRERKNRVGIYIDPQSWGVLNYDALKVEDIDYYLHSRLHRSQYYQFVVMLQKARELLLKEQRSEEDFISMMVGQAVARGLSVKPGYNVEDVVRTALDKVKERLKWKRPVSTKERETYTLVERTLFSKAFIGKYFNRP